MYKKRYKEKEDRDKKSTCSLVSQAILAPVVKELLPKGRDSP